MELLGGAEREPSIQIEPHLITKNTPRAGPGTVGLGRATIQDVLHEAEIFSHDISLALLRICPARRQIWERKRDRDSINFFSIIPEPALLPFPDYPDAGDDRYDPV